MGIDLDFLRERYDNLLDRREATIRTLLVVPFLKMIGYDEEWFKFEEPVHNRRSICDISIYINRDEREKFFVETKRGDTDLKDDDVKQLVNYLNIVNVEWGLLTNGKQYYLVNNKIEGDFKQKLVFIYNLFDLAQDREYYLNYFTYNSLFVTRTSQYFKFFCQYKAFFKNKSWKTYENTILNFLTYLAEKNSFYPIEHLRPLDFKDYLIYDINKNKSQNKRFIASKQTVINKYAHIKNFFDILRLNKKININNFSELDIADILSGIEYEDNYDEVQPISEQEVDMLIEVAKNTLHGQRNELIILLLLYCGLGRSEIETLKIDDFDLENGILYINQRTIPLAQSLTTKIKAYLADREQKGFVSSYFFCKKYAKGYGGITDFNKVLSRIIESTNISKERKKQLDIALFKKSLIKRMYSVGYSLDDLVALTGLSLASICLYVSFEEICKNTNLAKLRKNHPYIKYFD
jgi:integrase